MGGPFRQDEGLTGPFFVPHLLRICHYDIRGSADTHVTLRLGV
jgi:hypothetical protein